MTKRTLRLACLSLLVLGCAQRLAHPDVSEDRVRGQIEDDAPAAFAATVGAYDRVLRIGERLRVENASACGDAIASSLGWSAVADRDFGGLEMRRLATQFLRAGKSPVVVALAPQGAAERAGVQVGDHVLSIDGHSVHTSVQVTHAEQTLAPTGASIAVERAETELELAVTPARACLPDVRPTELSAIGAWPWNGSIYVSLRLVELATDDQIAFSIAHALAQQLLGVDPQRANQHVPEPQATALAVLLCERAGFSVADIEPILELEAVEEPWTVITTVNPLANPYWRPKGDTWLGEIPRRIVALKMVRAKDASAQH